MASNKARSSKAEERILVQQNVYRANSNNTRGLPMQRDDIGDVANVIGEDRTTPDLINRIQHTGGA
jgi:hypothetical protein